MDAERRDADRAAGRDDDVTARARAWTAKLRTGTVDAKLVELHGVLGDVAASQALGQRAWTWDGPEIPAAEELGNGLGPAACLHVSRTVLRLTRDPWAVAHTPGTAAWQAAHFESLEIEEELYQEDLAGGRTSSALRLLRGIGVLRPVDAHEVRDLKVAAQAAYAPHESGARSRAQAVREIHRALHRHARLPDAGAVLRLASYVETLATARLQGQPHGLAWNLRTELRGLGATCMAWLTACERICDRGTTPLPDEAPLPEMDGGRHTTQGWWLRRQVESAAAFVPAHTIADTIRENLPIEGGDTFPPMRDRDAERDAERRRAPFSPPFNPPRTRFA